MEQRRTVGKSWGRRPAKLAAVTWTLTLLVGFLVLQVAVGNAQADRGEGAREATRAVVSDIGPVVQADPQRALSVSFTLWLFSGGLLLMAALKSRNSAVQRREVHTPLRTFRRNQEQLPPQSTRRLRVHRPRRRAEDRGERRQASTSLSPARRAPAQLSRASKIPEPTSSTQTKRRYGHLTLLS